MLRSPLPVNVAPVSYADNKHQNTFSSKLLENPVVAHAEAVKLVFAFGRRHSPTWLTIRGQLR
jgi:hypothetical protein